MSGRAGPVFVDDSGRRARRVRRLGMAIGLLALGYLALVTAGLMGASWVPRAAAPNLGGLRAKGPKPPASAGLVAVAPPTSPPSAATSTTVTTRATTATAPPASTATTAATGPPTSTPGTTPSTGPRFPPPGQAKRP